MGEGRLVLGSTISLVSLLLHISPAPLLQDHLKESKWPFKIAAEIAGQRCPFPGRLPHGTWTCEMQEIPIQGTSFLDQDAQSYPGKEKTLQEL